MANGLQVLMNRFRSLQPAHKAAVIMAALAVLWIASGVFSGDGNSESDAVSAAPSGPPQVRVATLDVENRASQLVLYGRTEGLRNVTLKAETQGQVAEVIVPKGQAVNKGDVIVRLDMDDRAARLEEARALLEQNQINYDAARKLSKEGYKSRLKLAEAKAGLATATARLKSIEQDVARTEIRAPFTGVVNDVPVETGDFVDVGAPAAQVVDLTAIIVTAEVAERYAPSVRAGSIARVRLADGRTFPGLLRYVSRVSDVNTRTFQAEVLIESPDGTIAEGMTAELMLEVASSRAHRISPAILTLSEDGTVGVKGVDANNVVQFYPVTLVADTTEGIWVSGLPDSFRVIVVGQEFVRAGQTVQPVETGTAGG